MCLETGPFGARAEAHRVEERLLQGETGLLQARSAPGPRRVTLFPSEQATPWQKELRALCAGCPLPVRSQRKEDVVSVDRPEPGLVDI